MRKGPVRLVAALAFVTVTVALVSADTLILRDGRRIHGDLVAVRNGTVEFAESGGYSNRVLRIPREDVRRIEFEDEYDDRRDRDRDREPVVGAGGRPRGMREREVVVSADVPWIDTGIDVRPGQMIYFNSRGTTWWGPGRKDGPAGERNSPHNPNRPMPNRPAAALIGKIGDDAGDLFFIGADEGPVRMRGGGRLFLGVNDDVLTDNRGNYRVTVYY